MTALEIPIDTGWVAGLLLAMTRIGAFVVVSPIIGRVVGTPARVAFTIAVALAVTVPVPSALDVPGLVGAGVANAVIGGVLGFLTGLIMHLFSIAGGVVDFVSGLSLASVFDPVQGEQGSVFGRLFHLTGVALFLVAGGLGLLVGALAASVRVLPLDAGLAPTAVLSATAVDLTTQVFRSGVELALPIVGVLLMLELALGLATRFAPQANIFLLGLPLKILVAITVVGSSFVLFPDAIAEVQRTVGSAAEAALRGLGA